MHRDGAAAIILAEPDNTCDTLYGGVLKSPAAESIMEMLSPPKYTSCSSSSSSPSSPHHHDDQRPLSIVSLRTQSEVSSASSSLDSCLQAFPLTTRPLLTVAAMSKLNPSLQQMSPPTSPTSISSRRFQPVLHPTSPLFTALQMSDHESATDTATFSSLDTACPSPLLAEVKGRMNEKRGAASMEGLQQSSSLPYIRAMGHWQEHAAPPVPTIPPQFQMLAAQSNGWTKCKDPNTAFQLMTAEVTSDIVKVDVPDMTRYDCRGGGESITYSSSKLTNDAFSEHSFDTNSSSQYATYKVHRKDSACLTALASPSTFADKRYRARAAMESNKGSFAITTCYNDSVTSFVSSSQVRPDSASRRIAFAPSVRIANAIKPKQSSQLANIGSQNASLNRVVDEMQNEEAKGAKQEERVTTLVPTKGNDDRMPRCQSSERLKRPTTAPATAKRPGTASSFRNLLRPLSRQNRGHLQGESTFSRLQTSTIGKAAVESQDWEEQNDVISISERSVHSVHAPLHPNGPFGPSQPDNSSQPLEATRVEELPSPQRAFYPGTLILVKDGKEAYPSEHILESLRVNDGGRVIEHHNSSDDALFDKHLIQDHDNVLWNGSPLQASSKEGRALNKFRKAVSRVAAAFSKAAASHGLLEEVDFDDKVHSKLGDRSATFSKEGRMSARGSMEGAGRTEGSRRPLTAPSSSATSSPQWRGVVSFQRMTKIVSKQEAPPVPSILLGAKVASKERLEALRDMEELRKRGTIWDQNIAPAYPTRPLTHHHHHHHRQLPSLQYSTTQRRDSEQSMTSHFTMKTDPCNYHTAPLVQIATTPTLGFPSGPVKRAVSVEQLKRMQPVKLVAKRPIVY